LEAGGSGSHFVLGKQTVAFKKQGLGLRTHGSGYGSSRSSLWNGVSMKQVGLHFSYTIYEYVALDR
jgi:hypothetical protein